MMRWDKRNKIKGVGWGKEVQACDGKDEKFGTVGRKGLREAFKEGSNMIQTKSNETGRDLCSRILDPIILSLRSREENGFTSNNEESLEAKRA